MFLTSQLADKGARLGNYIIDTIIITIVSYIFIFVVALFFPVTLDEDSIALELLYLLLFFLYYFIFELTLGKTPGKYLTKTSVFHRNGGKPAWTNLIIRSLLRIIPIEAFFFLFSTELLHDVISKTRVTQPTL